MYASKYHDVPTVVEASARYDLKKGIEGRLGKDFMERIKKEGFIDIGNMMSLFYACGHFQNSYLRPKRACLYL